MTGEIEVQSANLVPIRMLRTKKRGGVGRRNISSYLIEFLEKEIRAPKNPIVIENEIIPIAALIAIREITDALRGNRQAIQNIMDRTEGRATDHAKILMEHTGQIKFKRLFDE